MAETHRDPPSTEEDQIGSSAVEFRKQLQERPEGIAGYAEWGQHKVLGVALFDLTIMYGGESFGEVEEKLMESHGENYALKGYIVWERALDQRIDPDD